MSHALANSPGLKAGGESLGRKVAGKNSKGRVRENRRLVKMED